jgi:hypothetical protein
VSGYVYFITTAEAERVKIGYTKNNPQARLRDLQVGSPVKLCIIATQRGSCSLERELHGEFDQYRLHGEWFELASPIAQRIAELNRKAFAEAEAAGAYAPKWVRMFHAFECGASPEEADAA